MSEERQWKKGGSSCLGDDPEEGGAHHVSWSSETVAEHVHTKVGPRRRDTDQ